MTTAETAAEKSPVPWLVSRSPDLSCSARELHHIVADSAREILFDLGPEEEEGLLERLTSTVAHIGLEAPIVVFADTEPRGDLQTQEQAPVQQMITSFLTSADSVCTDQLDRAQRGHRRAAIHPRLHLVDDRGTFRRAEQPTAKLKADRTTFAEVENGHKERIGDRRRR